MAREELAEYCDVFCEAKVFSTAEARKILSAARKLGFGLRIHADQLSLSGGAKLAAELRAATADHLEHTDAAGIAALAGRGRAASTLARLGLCAWLKWISCGAK